MIKGIFIIQPLNEVKFRQVLALGINTVFIGHQNLEKTWLDKFHQRKIDVCAEIGLFSGEEMWKKYPDSQPIDRMGSLMRKIDWYDGVCPNHPEVRKEKMQLIKAIISNFEIDGICLDFIRYPCHWEVPRPELTEYCFCQNCLRKFRKEKSGESRGKKWIKWKCDQITDFVAGARDLIAQSGKKVKLSMFSVPWREKDFDKAITKIIGQDFQFLARYIDIFSPMAYHKMCGQTTKWIREIVAYMDEVTGKPVLPIIQTEDKPEKISMEEFSQEINEAIKKPSQGVIVFFLEDLLKDKNKERILGEFFRDY